MPPPPRVDVMHVCYPFEIRDFVGATAGYKLSKGWTAAVTGSGAITPFMESKFDVMAKLAYNQVYRVREVR